MDGQSWDNRLRAALSALLPRPIGIDSVPAVLIIDQFEEFFAELTEGSARKALGSFLNDPCPPFAVKVLCAIRHDYLIDMHDLAPALAEPLSTKSTFRVRNFTEAQAANVIEECAKIDELSVSPNLASTISIDLAMGGPVRPPELQVVCTALGDSLTLEHYRAAGGAKGILSEYVRNALALCPDPSLGKRLLRVLCDFDASPPIKSRPRTIRELMTMAGTPDESLDKVECILNQFQTARLVVASSDTHGRFAYALVHDYLVSPIGAATSEISTRTERANQALRLYFAQRQADPSAIIPLRQYRFIKRHAARELLDTSAARQIIKASHKAYLSWAGGFLSLLGVVTLVLLIGINTKEEIAQETVGMQFPNLAGNDEVTGVSVKFSSSGESIITGPSSDSTVKFWDPLTSDSLAATRADSLEINVNDHLLIRPLDGEYELTEITTGRKQQIPIPSLAHRAVFVSNLDSILLIFDLDTPFPDDLGNANATLQLWSLKSGPIASIPNVRISLPHVTVEGRRVVLWSNQGGRSRPVLWKTDAADVPNVTPLMTDPLALASPWKPDVDEQLGRIVSCEVRSGRISVHLWDLESGVRIQSRSFQAAGQLCRTHFNDEGTAILLTSLGPQDSVQISVLDIPNLAPISFVPRTGLLLVYTKGHELVSSFAWGDDKGEVVFWNSNLKDHPPVTLHGLAFRDIQSLVLDSNETFLLAQLHGGSGYQVWNVKTRERVIVLGRESRVRIARFAEKGDILNGTDERNWVSLYDLRTGKRMDWFNVLISNGQILTYDRSCERVHVWTSGGVVIRYTRGLTIPFLGFRPARKCRTSSPSPSHRKL
jgi:WD40 repeat protein